jgi:hypothetical protein
MRLIPLLILLLAAATAAAQDPPTAYEDTLVVSTGRVTVEEVIRAIGEKMEAERYRIENYEYTTLETMVLYYDEDGPRGTYETEQRATRLHYDRQEGGQYVELWERTQKFEDGALVEEETKEPMESEWVDFGESARESMPFAPGGSGKYSYRILDRRNVGNNLIYKIRFEPKSRFDALPSGTVWVDYSNWVIRKVEAEMTGAVPYPMFLKSMPVIRMSQERFGDYWFMTDFYVVINLRKVPLLPIPIQGEIHVQLQDVVINGMPVEGMDTVPDYSGQEFLADLPEPNEFWLSPEAAADSLNAYWSGIEQQWIEARSPQLEPVVLSAAKIDSLSLKGAAELTELREGGAWRFSPSLLTAPQYNRATGPALFVGAALKKAGPNRPGVEFAAGYGFSNKRWLYDASIELPLVKSRWDLPGGRGKGRGYQVLSLSLQGRKQAVLFAGDGRRYTRSAAAFFYGSDPNHWYENRGGQARLTWRAARPVTVWAGGGYFEHRRLEQRTSWNVLGRRLRPDGNYAAQALDEVQVTGGLTWEAGPVTLDGEAVWHRVRNSTFVDGLPGSPDQADFFEWTVGAELDLLDGKGNQWVLRGRHHAFDRQTPLQWKTWLGDYGTLRGYRAGELTGDSGSWASLDVRFGFDLWQGLKVPLLRGLGLQPIAFADWGRTQTQDGPYPPGPEEGVADWRADAGFGFGRRFDLPGLGAFNKFRMYAAHPVGQGSDGRGWRFLVAFEK